MKFPISKSRIVDARRLHGSTYPVTAQVKKPFFDTIKPALSSEVYSATIADDDDRGGLNIINNRKDYKRR